MLLFDKLLALPLFQGMSHNDLDTIVSSTKFEFRKSDANTVVFHEGDAYTDLCFVILGTLRTTTTADDHSYRVTEYIKAPLLLQPDRLFGLRQRFTHTYTAMDEVHLMLLDKAEVMMMLEQYIIFRLNFLNQLSTGYQNISKQAWRRTPDDLRGRIIRFFEQHSSRPAGEKRFDIMMNTLAKELNVSRLDVSKALHSLQDEKLIEMGRQTIHIPALEKLLM